jgi:arsenite methyltransferase
METTDFHKIVQNYYGKQLTNSADLQTSCCTAESPKPEHAAIISTLPDEILSRFYGCGSPIPDALEGLTVLDLGCGTGRDAFLLSRLVGPSGKVIGVDMTAEQLDVARKNADEVARIFGHDESNVTFKEGFIEDLAQVDVADASVDLVISNCVINLSPNKDRVFAEIFRVLRPGGELYFSDVFADRRVPEAVREDPVLYGECLGGALYLEDFRRELDRLGCADYRVVSRSAIPLEGEVAARAGTLGFESVTVRAFKLTTLEDRCEDYGQAVIYRGTLPGHPHGWDLDNEHRFDTGRVQGVCRNTALMLSETRFAPHFEILGDGKTHFGLFADCGTAGGSESGDCGCDTSSGGGSCC